MAGPTGDKPWGVVVVQRVIYGAAAIAVLVTLFALDAAIAARAGAASGTLGALLRYGSVLPLVFLFILWRGAAELHVLLRATQARPCWPWAYLMIATMVLTPWVAAAGLLGDSDEFRWQMVWMATATVGTAAFFVLRSRPEGTFRDTGATLLMIMYSGFLGSFALRLRCSTFLAAQDGVWLLLIILLIAKAADIGGFFVGSAIGRHKLIPAVSPGKSVEGTIGALLAGGLTAVLAAAGPSLAARLGIADSIGAAWPAIASVIGPPPITESGVALEKAFLFGILVAFAGQYGDLIESCFKRDAGSKDSGKVIPQFGGILDLIDSPLLAMPVAWLVLAVIWEVI